MARLAPAIWLCAAALFGVLGCEHSPDYVAVITSTATNAGLSGGMGGMSGAAGTAGSAGTDSAPPPGGAGTGGGAGMPAVDPCPYDSHWHDGYSIVYEHNCRFRPEEFPEADGYFQAFELPLPEGETATPGACDFLGRLTYPDLQTKETVWCPRLCNFVRGWVDAEDARVRDCRARTMSNAQPAP